MDERRCHGHLIAVQPEDIDDLGHVNNAVYLRYIEDVARAHALRVGMPLERMRELGAVPVVRRHVITYHRAAMLGEQLWVLTEILEAGGIRAKRHNEVRRATDEVLLVEADTDWVWVDPVRERPRNCPALLLEAFGF
ncbi:thioesterase superfamily protein [Allomeiothermus silvanus DSM 9946]|uniref:Thioesterase superfamily protein n=1 Tax=Allomeiothermus silvanus (strain ATCC 700542 / DSM 9946 / NBRC 106475 / NCIMB 13440 / VI-R2) TaxID=526227 RepID=D7BGN6_ALLS1|nr:acyl-CoA thioesterase [Allomeiothermus silvanus]ADH62040.1 thioesterase superfamily protein [Allomeiothermus silvanus DSM 9946]